MFTGWWFGTWLSFFPSYWECHHPNWRTHIFQRGWRKTTNQKWFVALLTQWVNPHRPTDLCGPQTTNGGFIFWDKSNTPFQNGQRSDWWMICWWVIYYTLSIWGDHNFILGISPWNAKKKWTKKVKRTSQKELSDCWQTISHHVSWHVCMYVYIYIHVYYIYTHINTYIIPLYFPWYPHKWDGFQSPKIGLLREDQATGFPVDYTYYTPSHWLWIIFPYGYGSIPII